MNTVEVKNVSKQFKGFSIDNISFAIKQGYITGFIGPNGAGKSTTLKLILNLVHRDSGEIQVLNLDNTTHEKEIKDRIGFVFDENYYYDHLTIKEMRRIIAPFYKKWDNPLFEQYIKMFDLPWNRKIKDLSKGMKMKFSLAVALSHHADFIVMDEPTAGLDPVFRRDILDILRDLIQDERKTVFFSTHITTDLDQVADYIVFINQGKIVFDKSKDEVLDDYVLVKGGSELLDPDIRKEFIGIRETSVGFEGLTVDPAKIKKLFAGNAVIERPTLEEIMFYTVRGNRNVSIGA